VSKVRCLTEFLSLSSKEVLTASEIMLAMVITLFCSGRIDSFIVLFSVCDCVRCFLLVESEMIVFFILSCVSGDGSSLGCV
jgi:hypothetical protein